MLSDRHAKALASPKITTRMNLFFKYSILGHVYLLVQIIVKEAKKATIADSEHLEDRRIKNLLLRPSLYNRINCFPNEFSACKLANAARSCIIENDNKVGSFYNLKEWRCHIIDLERHNLQMPLPREYMTLIGEEKIYTPSISHSMQDNSKMMSAHLKSVLCLNTDEDEENEHGNKYLSNNEVLEFAMQNDLPIFVSIDGSVKKDIATVSISIVMLD
jgi:hypothetical protein